MGHKEKETMINTFVHSKFSYRPVFVFGISVLKSPKLQNKGEKVHEKRKSKVSNKLRLLEIPERKQASPLLEILQNCLTV